METDRGIYSFGEYWNKTLQMPINLKPNYGNKQSSYQEWTWIIGEKKSGSKYKYRILPITERNWSLDQKRLSKGMLNKIGLNLSMKWKLEPDGIPYYIILVVLSLTSRG